jgi:transcriptional regulator with XRE-family HTH domain
MKQMGKRIHDKRVEKGLSMEELGKMLGVQRQTISKWEHGEVELKRSHVDKLSSIFHCSAAWLMGYENSTNVIATYEAEGQEPVRLKVDHPPIIGQASLRAKLYQAAVNVAPENLETAISLLESLSSKEE